MLDVKLYKLLLMPIIFIGMFNQLLAACDHANNPKVGVSVFIVQDGKILLGLRKNAHGAGTWAPPGGHLEFGESFEQCATREVLEEVGLQLSYVKTYAITNDVFENENKHYVTIFMISEHAMGEVQLLEPEKCECWAWFDTDALPENLFLPFKNLLMMQADSAQHHE